MSPVVLPSVALSSILINPVSVGVIAALVYSAQVSVNVTDAALITVIPLPIAENVRVGLAPAFVIFTQKWHETGVDAVQGM